MFIHGVLSIYKKRCGFTFIEIILSLSIFSIVLVALYFSFSIGVKAWQRGEENNEIYQEARIAFKKIGRDLRSAFVPTKKEIEINFSEDKEKKIKFIGEPKKVIFLSKTKAGISQIIYRMSSYEKGKILEREEKRDKGKRKNIVLAEIEDLDFRYYDTEKKEWGSQWNNLEELPAGVGIELHIGKKKMVFKQVVALPVGRKFFRKESE